MEETAILQIPTIQQRSIRPPFPERAVVSKKAGPHRKKEPKPTLRLFGYDRNLLVPLMLVIVALPLMLVVVGPPMVAPIVIVIGICQRGKSD